MNEYRILFLGDIVGRPGRKTVVSEIPRLLSEYDPTFVIANGENAAAGIGITPEIADELFHGGVDAITLGNHAFKKKEIFSYLEEGRAIVRPANALSTAPGRGSCYVTVNGIKLLVVNLCGRVYMDLYNDPFEKIDQILTEAKTPHVIVDFHAEATSEKLAMGYYLDSRVTAVLGTHTHVPTADERILPGGTAFQTDVGMCGPEPSILGMETMAAVQRFRSVSAPRLEVANERGVISGTLISVNTVSGRARSIKRIRVGS